VKTIHPDGFVLPNFSGRLTPLALTVAERLAERIQDRLDGMKAQDDMSEIYGLFGMASMFSAYAEGTLSDSQMYSFMSRMAIMKTPSPVQRLETLTPLDIKDTVRNLMNENTDAYENTRKLAEERREQIRARLKTDGTLMLLKEDKQIDNKDEPDEIRKLRELNG
jgi:hypothetical protein